MTAAAPARSACPAGVAAHPAARPASAVPAFTKYLVPEVVFGWGSLSEAGWAARRLGAQRPFVVTDAGLVEAGWWAELAGHLAEAGLRATVWQELTPNPKDHEVAAGVERYLASGCDVIVGLGGGSVIDAAKAIAVVASNGGQILDYEGVDKVTAAIPPTVMCPTTAGTGADVSQFAVITDTTRRLKATLIGRELFISATTAKFHVSNVMRKLAVSRARRRSTPAPSWASSEEGLRPPREGPPCPPPLASSRRDPARGPSGLGAVPWTGPLPHGPDATRSRHAGGGPRRADSGPPPVTAAPGAAVRPCPPEPARP
jgi:hypothetical protein